jgi:mRNA-degrading endonuclease RelE of RelBE toxin-antitoxin system
MTYRVEYSQRAESHLKAPNARNRKIVMSAVDVQLSHQPTVETRNRKKMQPNPLAPWELRVGDLRVYYDVVEGEEPAVQVLAIGRKRRNQIVIGGQVMELSDEDNRT